MVQVQILLGAGEYTGSLHVAFPVLTDSLWNAGIAQLAEHRFCKADVVGSNPIASSNDKCLNLY